MAFEPVLNMCFTTCSKIKFVDVTNVYHATNNKTGWGSANTAQSTDVDTAIITLLDSDDSTVLTYDVTTQLNVPITGDNPFTDFEYALSDGEYNLQYVITFDSGTVYTFTETIETSCNFECCVAKLLATVPAELCKDNCNTDYVDEVLLVEGLLYAYMCAASCEKDTIKTEIKKRLTRFCDFNCNCE